MVQDSFIVRCSHCGTKNRVPLSRVRERAVCGKCRSVLNLNAVFPQNAIDADDRTFDQEVIRFPGPVLVLIWARWCGHCQVLLPIVDELAREYSGLVKFVKVDMDRSPGLASQYQIQSVPTMLLFKNGQLLDRLLGALPKDQIISNLRKLL